MENIRKCECGKGTVEFQTVCGQDTMVTYCKDCAPGSKTRKMEELTREEFEIELESFKKKFEDLYKEYNVFLNKEDLTTKRNKLNRQISALKKQTLKE